MLNFALMLTGLITVSKADTDVGRVLGGSLFAVGLSRSIDEELA